MQAQNDWTLSFKGSFKNAEDLYRYLGWPLSEELIQLARTYPVFVPKRLASKIKAQGPEGVLAKEFLPHFLETDADLGGLTDPIGDRVHHKAPQLVHRYSNRVLFTPTTACPVHCRYCFRKNELYSGEELFQSEFDKTLEYLRQHPEVSEVIFTGGDPFTLSNGRIEKYLLALGQITSIRHVRFHTRYPVILPERIDRPLLELIKNFSEIFQTVTVSIHANHLDEFDVEVDEAIAGLARLPIQLLSQTVLLKGVNDSVAALVGLMEKFVALKVRPYYLHHPDRVKGAMHFYTPLREGRKLFGELRQHLPGWALPHYVVDVPGGFGKVQAFNPEAFEFSGTLLALDGSAIGVPEPDLFV